MGRPRKPTALKVLEGTNRADRENKNEPAVNVEIPEPPEHLSELALIEWHRIAPVLFKYGLLSNIDMAALAAYCQAFSRWAKAETQLKTESYTIKTDKGNIIQNPLVGIANQAMIQMRAFLIEFGMTPASRTKVSANKPASGSDPWADFA
jgi:P27 family predicted phage terminase small subunit